MIHGFGPLHTWKGSPDRLTVLLFKCRLGVPASALVNSASDASTLFGLPMIGHVAVVFLHTDVSYFFYSGLVRMRY